MSVILSLQGCMAVGKTTAAKYVENNMGNVFVSYENPLPILDEVKSHRWDKNTLTGFIEIQRLFINAEIYRWDECKKYEYVLMDLGADEIEFITLYYPKSMGFEWEIEQYLKDELLALHSCVYNGALYLDASIYTLVENKKMDTTRRRGFFDHYLSNLNSLKKEWFTDRVTPTTDFLNIDDMSKEQVGNHVVEWIQGFQ